MDKGDAVPMALVFIKQLDRVDVPYVHYEELYHRAIGLRAKRYAQGLKCDDFSVDMMVACWTGDNGLKAELRQKEIERGRTLQANAESICNQCFGSGWRQVKRGDYYGTEKCDHGNK